MRCDGVCRLVWGKSVLLDSPLQVANGRTGQRTMWILHAADDMPVHKWASADPGIFSLATR